MVSGGMTCIKYLLFCFNLVFAVSGIAVLTAGAVIHALYFHYSEFVYESYESIPVILIIVGIIVFVIAFFGCCGAVRENHCMIVTFSVFLVVIFCLELTTGIIGYVKRSEIEGMLENKMNSTMYKYYNTSQVQNSWDILQHEVKCCGMNGPEDWTLVNHFNNSLPHTCCPNSSKDDSCTINSLDKYTKSCLEGLKEKLQNYAAVLGGIGIGVACVQLFGIIFACCLARSIRKEYETV
ncbi:CD63 antigen [Agrilus planipennis]|uniref:Tetraspanin n=1 Tax=Agrilus planipennis TaxID=224129 RepID=A0A1W4XRX4_AGRPL|nr:CD63 antigen [Agrilus planipennis]